MIQIHNPPNQNLAKVINQPVITSSRKKIKIISNKCNCLTQLDCSLELGRLSKYQKLDQCQLYPCQYPTSKPISSTLWASLGFTASFRRNLGLPLFSLQKGPNIYQLVLSILGPVKEPSWAETEKEPCEFITKQVWRSWAVIIIIIFSRDSSNLLCLFLIISFYYQTKTSISFSEFWAIICFNRFWNFRKHKKKN